MSCRIHLGATLSRGRTPIGLGRKRCRGGSCPKPWWGAFIICLINTPSMVERQDRPSIPRRNGTASLRGRRHRHHARSPPCHLVITAGGGGLCDAVAQHQARVHREHTTRPAPCRIRQPAAQGGTGNLAAAVLGTSYPRRRRLRPPCRLHPLQPDQARIRYTFRGLAIQQHTPIYSPVRIDPRLGICASGYPRRNWSRVGWVAAVWQPNIARAIKMLGWRYVRQPNLRCCKALLGARGYGSLDIRNISVPLLVTLLPSICQPSVVTK